MTFLNQEAQAQQPQPEQNITQQVDANVTQQNQQQNIPDNKESHEDSDPNWRAFREGRKKDRAEKEAAERRAAEKELEIKALKAAMEAAYGGMNTPTPQAYQQYYGTNQGYDQQEETEEQKIERKVNEIISKKEQAYIKEQQEIEAREWPNRIKRDIPDIWNVCSQENLDYLDYHYPEISRPLQRFGDGYEKWHDTYHAIKKLIPNHSNAKREAARAEVNQVKPKSMSAAQMTNPGQPARETWQESEARRAENWARMQRTLKGL